MRLIISHILVWMMASFVSTYAQDIPPEMEKLMNKEAQPCDNYYEYACGKWLKSKKKNPEKVEFAMKKIEEKRQELLNKMIKNKYSDVSQFWDSCMTLRYRKRDRLRGKASSGPGNEPLLHDLNRIALAKTHHDIFNLIGEFSRTGTNAFIEHSVQPSQEDYTKYALYLRPAKLILPDRKYRHLHTPFTGYPHYKYIDELIQVAFKKQESLRDKLYTGDGPTNVIKTEIKLWKIKTEHRGSTKEMLLDDVKKRWPNTLRAFLGGMGHVSRRFKIYIERSDYFDKLENEINKFTINNLKSHLATVMIHSRVTWLGEDFLRLADETIRGTNKVVDREKFCKDRLVELMPSVAGKHFTELGFSTSQRNKAKDMVHFVKEAMKDHILYLPWMSRADIETASHKLDAMITMVAQPKYKSSVPHQLTGDNYYANVHAILEHKFEHALQKIGTDVKREGWPKSPALAEVQYDPQMNSVLFPTAMLQSPLFNGESVHPARDFGAMGTIMGREITRGFDRVGSQHGKLGNNKIWWNPETLSRFHRETQCVVTQYNAFEHNGQSIIDVDKFDQIIADIGGLALAWDAYKLYMNANKNKELPGTSSVEASDGEKLFFLAFAQSLCTHIPNEQSTVSDTKYTPPKFRVNGAIMNHDHFHMLYGCKNHDKMQPPKQCKIW